MTSMPAPRSNTLWRQVATPHFIAAVIILGIAAVGLRTATGYLQLHFQKRPVPLRHDLKDVPARLGVWEQVSVDEPLDKETEEVLGAKQYIFRNYVDSGQVSRSQLDAFKDKSNTERQQLLAKIEAVNPKAVLHVQVAYYTGMVDTVAHIPDRCYIAGGFEVSQHATLNWDVKTKQTPDGHVEASYLQFEDQSGQGPGRACSVAYLFHVNGIYKSDSIGVRVSLQDLRERYGYYAKIELMNVVADQDQSARAMKSFLTAALPEIENCLPDWAAVNQSGVK